ncbi:MAG TPA: hypothetical protein PLY93_06795, partial [Turneriella sp.]|nr:hypothetical protein [Turneriella sp.]
NNLRARIAVLTRIDLDHQNVLGDTLEKIAYEKAGIIHERQHVYSFAQAPSVFAVLKETAAEKNAHLDMLNTTEKNFIDQNRDYARQILKREFSISETQWEAVGEVLQKPIFGRLTQLSATPRIFFDSAHNAVSMHALAAFINTQKETHVQIFINTMTERDLAAMVQILRHTILQKVDFFLFPIFSLHYYVSLPEDSGISTVDDDAIRTLIARKDVLNFFTGSMGIYKELRERFNL